MKGQILLVENHFNSVLMFRQLLLGGELSRPGLGYITSIRHSAEGVISFQGACAHDADGYVAGL
jgi:hypothetical protein